MTAELKIEVAEFINTNPTLDNKEIASVKKLSASKISSIRYWNTKKGKKYISDLRLEVAKELEAQYELAKTKAKKVKEVTEYQARKKVLGIFANFKGEGKEGARLVMVNAIAESKLKKGSVLTLPCSEWNIEKLLYTNISKSFSYVACESQLDVFTKMAKNMKLYGRSNKVHFGTLSEKIMIAKENEYDHIIADYCGTLETARKELIHACLNNIVKLDGTISVTLFKARNFSPIITKLNNFTSELSGKFVKSSDNENAIKMFFDSLANITNFEVTQTYTYNDSSPMILIVLKRTS